MQLIHEHVLPAKTGHAVEIRGGQHLRIVDVEGKQCCDLAVFNLANLRDKLSTSYSRTRRKPKPGDGYRSLDRLLPGDVLYSTICTPLMTIVEDTAEPQGIHDTYIRMCNRMLYESFGLPPQDGCLETISALVAPYGLQPEELPDPFNVFLNLEHSCEEGRWITHEPVTKPGDYIEFRAELDCLIAISNCPEDTLTPCNAYHCTPIKVEVFEP
jgi:uncharacterized protein YcgI (DUF1989 family)